MWLTVPIKWDFLSLCLPLSISLVHFFGLRVHFVSTQQFLRAIIVLGLYFVNNDTALWWADCNLEFLLFTIDLCFLYRKHNMNIHKSMGLLHLSYHRYIKETKQIQTSCLTFCAFDIELFKLYRCLTGNLSTLCRDICPLYLYHIVVLDILHQFTFVQLWL